MICVDDVYDERVDIEDIIVWAVLPPNHKTLNGILTKYGSNLQAPSDTLEAELRTMLEGDNQFAVKCQASIDRYRLKKSGQVQLGDNEDQLRTDRIVLCRLDELLDGFVQFLPLAPQAWQTGKQDILATLATEKTLLIFDEKLGQNVASGTDQIKEIALTPDGGNAVYVLLSYGIQAGEEHARTRAFQADNIAATAIPKRNWTDAANIDFLQNRLRAAIMWKESANLRRLCKRAMSNAVILAEKRVRALTPLEFDEVVFRSSFEEGVHEMDTLVRVYTNALASHLRENLRQNKGALKDIDTLRKYRTNLSRASEGSEAWKLQREEYYEAGSYINGCRMPIEAGDVFEVTADNGEVLGEYVLVAPPCDLMIRSTGGRAGTRKIEGGLLCPIRSQVSGDDNKGLFELSVYAQDTETTAQVEMTKAVSVSLWLLDLCALSADGAATCRLDGKVPRHLSEGWKLMAMDRLAVCTRAVAESWSSWQQMTETERGAQSAIPAFRIPFTANRCLQVTVSKPAGQPVTVAIGIRRMQRLSANLAAELLQAFSDHLARPARPHSLSRSSTV
ncbi:MAG: hypothetical protein ACR2HJ_04890 [Fimbriimonadales bacterium]